MRIPKSTSVLHNIKKTPVAKTVRKAVLTALVSLMTLTAAAKNTDSFNYTNEEQVKTEQMMQKLTKILLLFADLSAIGVLFLVISPDIGKKKRIQRENYLKYRKNVLEDLEKQKKIKEKSRNRFSYDKEYSILLSKDIKALSEKIEQYQQIPPEFKPHKKYTRVQIERMKKNLQEELKSASENLEELQNLYKPSDIHEITIDVPEETEYIRHWNGSGTIVTPYDVPAHKETEYYDSNEDYNNIIAKKEKVCRVAIEYINGELNKIRKYEAKKLK